MQVSGRLRKDYFSVIRDRVQKNEILNIFLKKSYLQTIKKKDMMCLQKEIALWNSGWKEMEKGMIYI